jgi:transcriptional regulator with XRE-family HTH domain
VFHLERYGLYMDTPEQTSREISRTVSEALRVAGISQRSAADLTGIPLTTLNRRLTGAAPFLVTELYSLAKVLGTTVSALTETAA